MEETRRDGTTTILTQAFAFIVVLTFLLMMISFPVGLYTVFYTQLSNSTSYNNYLDSLVLLVGLIPVRIPVQFSVGTAFVSFLAVYALFFAIAAFQRMRITSAFREFVSGSPDALFQNPLLGTIITLGAINFGLTVLDIVQTRSGIPTGQLTGDPLYLFLGITMAPLTEEFGFRLVLIGIPMFLAAALSRRSLAIGVRTLWRPSAGWQQEERSSDLGNLNSSTGPTGHSLLRLFAYFLLFLSSIVFGLAHYLSNSGWDLGKISEAALAGVALGYLYIRYGFHTNVLLHWGVNYFGTVYAFLSQGLWNIPWTSDTGSPLTLFVEVLVIIVLGLPSFLILVYKFLKRRGVGADVVTHS